jgi:hypothetical protein
VCEEPRGTSKAIFRCQLPGVMVSNSKRKV